MSTEQQSSVEAVAAPAQEMTALDVLNAHLAKPDPGQEEQPVEAQAEQPKVEEAPKVEEPKDDKFAAKFAALSRREKEIRQREQKALQREREMEARLKALEEKEGNEESWKKNPLDMLKKKGLDYETLTKEYILKGEPTPEEKQNNIVQELQAKLQEIQEQLLKRDEDSKKQAEEAQKQREITAKQAYLRQLTSFINEGGEKYELIQKNDAVQVVYDTMEELYSAKLQEEGEGYVLTPDDIAKIRDDAAEAVEAHLLEEAKKIIESNKLKSLMSPVAKTDAKAPVQKKQPVTLSNEHTQQASNKSDEFLSDDESKRKIAQMLKWHE